MAIFYGIVVFHLIPLLIWGSGQDVAESLTLNVAGYFGIYFIVLDNHTLPTVLISLYAVAACIKAAVTQASFTKGSLAQVGKYVDGTSLLRFDGSISKIQEQKEASNGS